MDLVGDETVDGFEIRVAGDFIRLWIEEMSGFPDHTSYLGGYDAHGVVDIKCGPYRVHDSLWFSTGEVWQFYTELQKAYNDLAGQARFRSDEENLDFTLAFTGRGHFVIAGVYRQYFSNNTLLQFEIESEQSYLIKPLAQLAAVVAKYGDNRGIKR